MEIRYHYLCLMIVSFFFTSCIKNELGELQEKKIALLESRINDLEKKIDESKDSNKISLKRIENKVNKILIKVDK